MGINRCSRDIALALRDKPLPLSKSRPSPKNTHKTSMAVKKCMEAKIDSAGLKARSKVLNCIAVTLMTSTSGDGGGDSFRTLDTNTIFTLLIGRRGFIVFMTLRTYFYNR
jgi:hypothetical protein